jgi:hypothetical protein
MCNIIASVFLLGAASISTAAPQFKTKFSLVRTDKVDCISRATIPSYSTPFADSKYRIMNDKEQADYDAAWAKFDDEKDACWVFSTASNQWVLIETGQDYRARTSAEKPQSQWPVNLSTMKVYPLPPTVKAKPKASSAKESDNQLKPNAKKLDSLKIPFRMDRGHLLCDLQEIKIPDGIFKKVTDEKILIRGYTERPFRPVLALGFPLQQVYLRINDTQKTALIVSRVSGNASAVDARLHELHSNVAASLVANGVPGTWNTQLGVRYSLSLPKSEGISRTLLVEQPLDASFTDIVCSLKG